MIAQLSHEAIAAYSGVIVSVLALLVSVVSIWATVKAMRLQKEHNYKSFAPIPWISLADYEDQLSVKIFNNGVGPLIIDRVEVTDGRLRKPNVIDWMSSVPTHWSTFISELRNRSIAAGQSLTLLEWQTDGSKSADKIRDLCRSELMKLKLVMHWRDIYDRSQPPSERSFEWFGRNLERPENA